MAVTKEESSSSTHSRSPSYNGAYYLAKSALRSSVVLQVVQGHFRSPASNDVVFGKETAIELAAIAEDGIVQSICEQSVFGMINDLAVLPWNEKFQTRNPQMLGKDMLLVVSDSGKLSFLTFCNEMHRFFQVTHVQLSDPGNARHHINRMLAVDSSGSYIAVSAYEERLTLFSVSASSDIDMIDKRITYPPESEDDLISRELLHTRKPTLTSLCAADSASADSESVPPVRSYVSGTVWSMCFISKNPNQLGAEHNPVLAVLVNRRGSSLNELQLLGWDVCKNSIRVLSQFVDAGPLAFGIVDIPWSCGYAYLLRIGDILLLDLRDDCNPVCVQRITLSSSVPVIEEHNCTDEVFRLQDGDDEGFIAAHALLQLQDYGMDINKVNDPMSIDSDMCTGKSAHKYVCSWSWEPGIRANPRMLVSDDSGELFLVEISFKPDGPNIVLSDCLYHELPCRALLWTEGGFVAAIVEMGDGVLLKLECGKLEYSSPIQNIAPILDMSVTDYNDKIHDQLFASCGMAREGSLRIIRSGISVDILLRTSPIYQGITAIWTVKMKKGDSYHSFLVLSFVEETRVLSVGVSFTDVTDSVGFQSDVCTLACGVFYDGLLVQIHQSSVTLCLPTANAHPEGIPMTSPACTTWSPDNIGISLGSVGDNFIVVATSNPCFLIILGVKSSTLHQYEVYEMQHIKLQSELSCISIPQKHITGIEPALLPVGVDIGNIIVIGTHKPSVEIISYTHGQGVRVLATGTISLTNTAGTAISGCVPQDVRLVLVDRLYVLCGLRNGMLLRFEWPTTSWDSDFPTLRTSIFSKPGLLRTSSGAVTGSQLSGVNSYEKPKGNDPVYLQLIAVRHIGITPVFLVPLNDPLDADVIALSDRPWLVQAARRSLSYTSISFQPSICVTPVCSADCPRGLLFVADNTLHLVEMVHSKRLNVQKFHLGGTPRKVLYHPETRLLLVLRTDLSNDSCSSDICCVDPLSGSVVSSFKLDLGETGKSMALVRVGYERVLVVGTSLSAGPAIMPTGEAECTKGRLIVLSLEYLQNSDSGSMMLSSKGGSSSHRVSPFREAVGNAERMSDSSLGSSPDDGFDRVKLEDAEAWQLRLVYSTTWPGVVLAICSYLQNYFLASSGNAFYVCGFPNDNPQRVRRYAMERTRFTIVSLTSNSTRIAVGDCRDGVLLYSYHEDAKKLEQIHCDPSQRLVADCLLTNGDFAIASDRKGSIAVLTSSSHLEDNVSPECNLTVCCSYYMGEIAVGIRKGSFSYKLPVEDTFDGSKAGSYWVGIPDYAIMAGTLLGSIVIFIPIRREDYELLQIVQTRLAVHPLTAPLLGNNHTEFRSRENQAAVPKVLDGDMLAQFLELTSIQQEAVLALPCATAEMSSSFSSPHSSISVDQVVELLERIHNALN